MSKKALVIVGLAAVIAASTGIAFASGHDGLQKTKFFSDNADSAIAEDSDAQNGGELGISSSFSDGGSYESKTSAGIAADGSQSSSSEQPSSAEGEESGQAADVSCIASFELQRVTLRESGEEQSPRVLFGKFASACYLKLYDDGTAEICLNPSAGIAEKGGFTVDDDKMYVDLGTDRTAEYQLSFADDGGIDMVIVPYGEYDIYFS